ncbi:MAG: alpha-galactosidase, partial [Lentisphaeria bacterium]
EGVEFLYHCQELSVCVRYKTSPELPGYEKNIVIKNLGTQPCTISRLDFDNACFCPGNFGDCDFYSGQEDSPRPPCFVLNSQEDLLRCHNPQLNEGWLLGSSAPGLLRHVMVYPHWQRISLGYNRSSAPFARQLQGGEEFQSASSFLSLYKGGLQDKRAVSNFRSMIRKSLPPLPVPEGGMYCTWLPFTKNINEELSLQLIDQACRLGMRYFVLDDGWFTANDHAVDLDKFPKGLEALAERCRQNHMTFGLWHNIGTSYGLSRPNPDWISMNADGTSKRLGENQALANPVMCLGSEYREFILQKLSNLCAKYKLGYFKLDFSSVSSPYEILPWGCHATEHEYHQGWHDSFSAMYEGMLFVREELKKRFPDLIVDFSFEAFGCQAPSIAALQYSELHHVSNLSGNEPALQNIWRLRRGFYAWLGKLPPERILNGLLTLQNDRAAEYFLTGLAGAPLYAGDLRRLNEEQTQKIQCYSRVFNQLAADGPLTEFEVLLDQPDLDGFMRYANAGRGFVCMFNRGEQRARFELPPGFKAHNVENGSTATSLPPKSCAMFKLQA